MTAFQSGTSEPGAFEVLGITEAEERTYDWLLLHPGASVPEVARGLALPPGRVQRLLDAIETKGLATNVPERPRRYVPAAPDLALEALALRHRESLLRAEKAIEKLKERTAAAQSQDAQRERIVEVVTSREVERQAVEQMERAAQHEFVSMTRAPMRITRLDVPPEENARVQREAQARGVRYRNIVDTLYAGLDGALERMRSDAAAGEEIRLLSGVPLKMLIADRRIAIVPLQPQRPDSPSLIVRNSALLDALYALFEVLWERAAAVSFTISGTVETGVPASRLSHEADELISLMAAGLNDKKIADELGISMRTLRRRAVELMKKLNARTRFQAGWFAARQQYDRQGT